MEKMFLFLIPLLISQIMMRNPLLCCLELTWYEMHMLHFIDILWKMFFGLLGFHSCLINWQRKDARILEGLYQQFVLLKMFTICIKQNTVLI